MDPKANLERQRELAVEIEHVVDRESRGDGSLSAEAAQRVAELADELAELVLALDEWRRAGGFDPYAGSAR